MEHFIKDLICGSLSGVGCCVSGYVFDTVKVRMQMDHSITMFGSFRSIIEKEGFMHLFNGIYYPLITLPLLNAVIFSAYQLYKKMRNKTQLNFIDGIQNGAFAGFVNTIIIGPSQLIKCRMQIDKESVYKNSVDCAKSIIRNQGVKGLMKGTYATLFRQIWGYAAYFAGYEEVKAFFITKDNLKLTIPQSMFVGSVAGVSCWVFSYPQDIVKTMIQVSEEGVYKKNKWLLDGGFYDCARKIYKKDGLKGFWVGIQPCLVRAVVANAISIAIYEQAQHFYTNLIKE